MVLPRAMPGRSSVLSRSLSERLRADDLQLSTQGSNPAADRIASIKANLVRILNGRAGGAASATAFGLEDFNDATVGSVDLLNIISTDIKSVISAYEPRVSDVTVHFDRSRNTGQELHFVISARTAVGSQNEKMIIDLVMKEGRNFSAL